jgi:hypothetical protein
MSMPTVFALAQDDNELDSAPTCVAFMRYGGGLATDRPKEGNTPVGEDDLRGLVADICETTERQPGDACNPQGLVEMLNEFAFAYGDTLYHFSCTARWVSTGANKHSTLIGQLLKALDSQLEEDGRGVIVPIYSTLDNPVDEKRNKRLEFGSAVHWVVYLGQEAGQAKIYDPGDRMITEGPRLMPVEDFVMSHLWCCSEWQQAHKKGLEGASWCNAPQGLPEEGVTSYFVCGSVRPEYDHLREGRIIADVEIEGTFLNATHSLVATNDAEYFYSVAAADEYAASLTEGGSIVVLERGGWGVGACFSVVRVNDVGLERKGQRKDIGCRNPGSPFIEERADEVRSIRLSLLHLEGGVQTAYAKTIDF